VFKRIFGKADDELAGLNVSRFASPGGSPPPGADAPDLMLPSRKPPPNVDDLVLPETLAEEAKHPREVDLRFVLSGSRPGTAASDALPELTDAQIEEIAKRVADKLAAGILGDRLREEVRRVVSETSERLVREEIARIRAEAEHE
jgi:hypothetical protein